jgi:CYTH domain-containing protein
MCPAMMSDPADWRRRPGHGRYARPERERRFLVAGAPEAVGPARLIEDRYLRGTTLRLRRVTVEEECIWKLTQKVRAADGSPAEVAITNIYLSGDEYRLLQVVPADELTKVRRTCPWQDMVFVIDDFRGRLAGLRLAEVEVTAADAPLALPPWLGREVTEDELYTGGRLAESGDEEIAALLGASQPAPSAAPVRPADPRS